MRAICSASLPASLGAVGAARLARATRPGEIPGRGPLRALGRGPRRQGGAAHRFAARRLSGEIARLLALAPLCSALWAGLGSGALAQTLPQPGQAVRQSLEQTRPRIQPLPEDAAEPELRFTSQTPPPNAGEISFKLKTVKLEGATLFGPVVLAPVYGPSLGQEITLAQLFAIAARIQTFYRDRGYIFTRVVVPAQRIEGGVVRLEVIEAVLSTVEIEAPGLPLGPVQALAEKMIAPLRGLKNPRMEQIERVLLLLNEIPGITRAAAVPKMGTSERGAVNLYVNMERKPISGAVFLDNRQSPIMGVGLLGATASLNSWSPYGDSTQLSVFNSADFDDPFPEDFQERWTVQLENTHFIGSSGLSLDVRALYAKSRPGDRVKDFDIISEQTEVSVALNYPLIRRRDLSFDIFSGLDWTAVSSVTPAANPAVGKDLITDDRLRVLFAGVSSVARDSWGVTEFRIELRHGLGEFGASPKKSEELSRSDGDPFFWSIRTELSRLQPVWGPISLWGKVWTQWADRPLLASEEMTLGGTDLGRGYYPSEYSGDDGVGGVTELRWTDRLQWRDLDFPVEVYGFADGGEIKNLDGGEPAHASVFSAGFGIRARLPYDLAVNVEAVKPINVPVGYEQNKDWRALFSIFKEF